MKNNGKTNVFAMFNIQYSPYQHGFYLSASEELLVTRSSSPTTVVTNKTKIFAYTIRFTHTKIYKIYQSFN